MTVRPCGKGKSPLAWVMDQNFNMMATSREELDGTLEVLGGQVPADLHGVFYVSYPVGSVNSGGLPFPQRLPNGQRNPEYGSPIMNGDGMVLKVDLANPQQLTFKTRLMKTACWWADYNTRNGQPDHAPWGFQNFGISRISPLLGARNLLNTAILPVRFSDQEPPFLMATYDVGRPWLLDPDSLKLISPLGTTDDWKDAQPALLPWPFGIEQTTAHPQFDPRTREWFGVSYRREGSPFVLRPSTLGRLASDPGVLKQDLLALAQEWRKHRRRKSWPQRIQEFFSDLDRKTEGDAEAKAPVSLNLIRWTGGAGLEVWSVTDEAGNNLNIAECMHQTGLTRDWIVLTDCSFKFKLDLLINNPFPDEPLVDEFLRHILSGPMQPDTVTYLIRRSDLLEGGGKVQARALKAPLPVETIHYSCDYENPNDQITLYGIHNAATCIAEWIRPYDKNKLNCRPVDPQFVGVFAIGSMDVSRVGKWTIDARTALVASSLIFAETGKKGADPGPNSWGAGLYTFRDMLSPDTVPAPLRYLWFLSYGTDRRMLTKFIWNLYKNYPNRIVSRSKVLSATRRNLPFGLVRLDTATMKATDSFTCPPDVYLRGLHFIPRQVPTPGLDPQLDGYLFCPVQVINIPGKPQAGFHSEFWVFDAAKVAGGPVCRWGSPKLQFAFTLHTAWMAEAQPYEGSYRIDVVADYERTIDQLKLGIDRQALKDFFARNVNPWFRVGP